MDRLLSDSRKLIEGSEKFLDRLPLSLASTRYALERTFRLLADTADPKYRTNGHHGNDGDSEEDEESIYSSELQAVK